MIKTYQGTVYPWNCDHMNHMNVKFYIEKFDEATWFFFNYIGLTRKFLHDNSTGLVALEQNIKYKKELLAGDSIFVESEIVRVKEKTIFFTHHMKKLDTQEIISETELIGLYIDRIKRKGIKVPDFISKKYKQA